MIVIPESISNLRIHAETIAEDFLISQFILAWKNGEAIISMTADIDGKDVTLQVSNQPPRALEAPIGERLVVRVKRQLGL